MKKKYRKWTLVIMRRLAWARQQSWVVFFSDAAPPSQCGSSRFYGFERDTQEELQPFIWMATLFKSASVLHDEINSQHKNLKRSNMMNWKKRQIQQQMMMKCSPRALVQTDCVRWMDVERFPSVCSPVQKVSSLLLDCVRRLTHSSTGLIVPRNSH